MLCTMHARGDAVDPVSHSINGENAEETRSSVGPVQEKNKSTLMGSKRGKKIEKSEFQ